MVDPDFTISIVFVYCVRSELPRQYVFLVGCERRGYKSEDFLETTLSYASIMGIKEDINLHGDDYQWLGSMFYFGVSEQN